MSEKVCCIKREIVDMIKDGLVDLDVIQVLTPKAFRRMDREKAETSEDWVQLVTYVFCTNGLLNDGEEPMRFLAYKRKGEEERLHGKWSVGIGGHINEDDYKAAIDPFDCFGASAFPLFQKAAIRELKEEIPEVELIPPSVPFTFIYMDNSPVNKVHLGLVDECPVTMEFDLDRLPHKEWDEIRWMTVSELKEQVDEFEDWSKELINNVFLDYYNPFNEDNDGC